MRNIWRIIKADARSLFTHFFALAVALVIAVLPSLYAWLNIYSNWDPYGNTGNISIAVASLDKGWTEEDGTQVNKGREVVDDLRTSTSINWVAVDTKEEAEHGVYAGDYYAAVVIGEDFSYNMYHMLTEWTGKPTITYYENYKKNAVATKITDTAVSSLKTTISKSYLDVVVDAVFRGANDLSDQLKGDDPVGSVQGLLGQARSLLRSCAQTVDAFQAAGQDNSSYRQDLSDLVANINQNRPDSQELLDTVAQLNRQVHAALDKAQAALDKAFDAAEKILNGIDVDAQLPQIQEDLRDAAQTMDDMGDKLTAWARSIAVEAGPVGAEAAAAAQRLADSCYQLRDRLNTVADGIRQNSAVLQDTIALVAQLEKLTDTLLTPVFGDVTDDVKNVLDQTEGLLQGLHGTAADTPARRPAPWTVLCPRAATPSARPSTSWGACWAAWRTATVRTIWTPCWISWAAARRITAPTSPRWCRPPWSRCIPLQTTAAPWPPSIPFWPSGWAASCWWPFSSPTPAWRGWWTPSPTSCSSAGTSCFSS